MRRIVLVLVLVGVFVVAGYMLLRPKPKAKSTRAKSSTAAAGQTSDPGGSASPATKVAKSSKSAKGGKVAGTLKATSKDERRAQLKKIKDAERARKKALKQQEREKRRMLKGASARGNRRKTGKGGGFYVLKAIIFLGDHSYVLIDGRKAQVGDVVMGRKIVGIGQDRIEVEAFGRQSTVRVGESLLPSSYSPKRK